MRSILPALLVLNIIAAAQNPQGQTSAPPAGIIDSYDPLLQPAPLPAGNASLIGGTVLKLDGVKNNLLVRPFGGKTMKVYFDDRTHIFRDGIETTQLGIRKNDRVYIDTLSEGGRVFARSIRVEIQGRLADARGRLVRFDRKSQSLSLLDELSSQPVDFRLDSNTVIRRGQQTVSPGDLKPNSLVGVHFAPDASGRGTARQIVIFAEPGAQFVFAGKLTFLDLKSGIFALQNQTDNHNYEIHFEPSSEQYRTLGVGAAVTVEATFDGSRYNARNITVNQVASQ